jgi:hypothetical protein
MCPDRSTQAIGIDLGLRSDTPPAPTQLAPTTAAASPLLFFSSWLPKLAGPGTRIATVHSYQFARPARVGAEHTGPSSFGGANRHRPKLGQPYPDIRSPPFPLRKGPTRATSRANHHESRSGTRTSINHQVRPDDLPIRFDGLVRSSHDRACFLFWTCARSTFRPQPQSSSPARLMVTHTPDLVSSHDCRASMESRDD